MKTITVIISKEGASRVEANGFEGNECRNATERLRRALGEQTGEQLKPEFAMQAQSNSQPLQAGGLSAK